MGIKVALVALLLHAVLFPDLPQYADKAMAPRAIGYPLAALLVPALWWLGWRDRPFPVAIDILVTTPFLIDVAGNALDLYDTVEWWDDANHFFNWMMLTAAVALALRWTTLETWPRMGLAIGFAAVAAIGWELAEYFAFIRDSSELATAYTDTLGDLALGTLGGAIGASLVELAHRGRAPAS